MNKTFPQPVPFVLRIAGILAKLAAVFAINVPVGYQDETGFHFGTKPAQAKISWPSRW